MSKLILQLSRRLPIVLAFLPVFTLLHCGLGEEEDCPITAFPLTEDDFKLTQSLHYRATGSGDLFYLPGECFGAGVEFFWDYSGEAIYNEKSFAANTFEVLTGGTMCVYMKSANQSTEEFCKEVTVHRDHIWGAHYVPFPGNETRQSVTMSINGDVYSGFGMNNDWYKFDTTTYRWTEKSAIPNLLDFNAFAGFSIGGKGYLIGNNSVLYEYNPSADTWSSKGSLPENVVGILSVDAFGQRGDYGHSVLGLSEGGKGYFGVGLRKRLFSYDPSTNTWTALTDRPEDGAIGDHHFAYQGKIYSGKYEYDIASDTWIVGKNTFTIAIGYSPGFVPFKGVMYGGLAGKTVSFDGQTVTPIDLGGATEFVAPPRNYIGKGAATGNLILFPRLLNPEGLLRATNVYYLDK